MNIKNNMLPSRKDIYPILRRYLDKGCRDLLDKNKYNNTCVEIESDGGKNVIICKFLGIRIECENKPSLIRKNVKWKIRKMAGYFNTLYGNDLLKGQLACIEIPLFRFTKANIKRFEMFGCPISYKEDYYDRRAILVYVHFDPSITNEYINKLLGVNLANAEGQNPDKI